MRKKFNCQNCKVIYNVRGMRFHKGKYLCHNCFQKVANLMPQIHCKEPLSENIRIDTALTYTQHNKLEKRIKSLFGEGRYKSIYLRSLILSDLEAK